MQDVPTAAKAGVLLGRDAELQRLADAIGLGRPAGQDADAAAAGAVLLSGDAGVGKTRVLAELSSRATAAGWRVIIGHCLDFGDRALPYLPFSEAFGRLAAEAPELGRSLLAATPALARLLPGQRLLAGADGARPEPVDRGELFEALATTLAALSRSQPLLLIIEDAHWADPSTREVLSYLFARPDPSIRVVASYRSDDLHRRHPLRAAVAEWSRLPAVQRLHLPPLAEADVRRLVDTLQPRSLSEAEIRGIVARADGNAFFVEELLAAAAAGNRALPTDLTDLLLVRLDRLDEAARPVVRMASVAGRRVSHALLARVAGADGVALETALRAAVDSNVLVPLGEDGYGFRHALLAEAVYADLLPGERVRLHRAYASALSAGDVEGTAAELARHARAAHDVPLAIRASIAAAEEAMAVAGPVEAAAHYELALELLADAEPAGSDLDLVTLTLRAAEATVAAGHLFRAVALLEDRLRAVPAGTDPLQRARLLHALAGTALLGDTGLDTLQLSTEALELVPETPPTPLRASVMATHAKASVDRLRDDDGHRWATEAMTLAGSLGLAAVAADAATTLARLDQRSGDPEASRRRLEQTLVAAESGGEVAGELRARFRLGSLHYELGHLAQAMEYCRGAVQRAGDTGRVWAPYGMDARVLSGIVAYVMGDWDLAARLADVTGEDPPGLAHASLSGVALTVAAGRGQRAALDLLPRWRAWWERDGLIGVISAGAAIDLYGDHGDIDGASAVHDDVVSCVARIWQQPFFEARIRLGGLLLGQLATEAARAPSRDRPALVQRGEELADAARRAAEPARPGRHSGPESVAWMARVTAEEARLRWQAGIRPPPEDELVAVWQRAVEAFEEFGHVFETARSQARLAAVLRAAGRTREASAAAELARTAARRLGAEPLLAELRILGPVPRSRPAEAAGPNLDLTGREVEVLTLVAQGRSNREIGQQLYISAKTASVHVSNILAKLGVAGRTEAVTVARDRGLLAEGRGARSGPG